MRATGARNRADAAYTELRRRVLSGETTGCPLRDVALAGPFSGTTHTDTAIEAANKHLRLMSAQFVAVIYRSEDLCVLGSAPKRFQNGQRFALGVFYDNKLVTRQAGSTIYCALPVYIPAHEDQMGRFVLDTLPGIFDLAWDREYILGDDAVLAWCEEHRPELDISPILIHFGKMDAPTGSLMP